MGHELTKKKKILRTCHIVSDSLPLFLEPSEEHRGISVPATMQDPTLMIDTLPPPQTQLSLSSLRHQERLRRVGELVVRLCVGILVTVGTTMIAMWVQKQDKEGASNQFEKEADKTIVEPSSLSERLSDVKGMDPTVKEMRRHVLRPLSQHKTYFRKGSPFPPPKGILLSGPPGTGKTMLAKAVAAEAGVPFLNITKSSLESKWFGDTPRLVKALWSLAKKRQPCILFFDEIDGIGRARSILGNESHEGLLTELLSQMDGLSSSKEDAIVTIACTNCPNLLDKALLRRFPRRIEVGLPTKEGRAQILKSEYAKLGGEVVPHSLLQKISLKTEGKSGSDLVSLVERVQMLRMDEMEDNPTSTKTGNQLPPLRWKEWNVALSG